MAMDLQQYNARVKDWATTFVNDAKRTGRGMGIKHRENSPSATDSLNRLTPRLGLKDGATDRIKIGFPRALIYTMKGAGRGRAGHTGSRWLNKYGNTVKTDPDSMGKMGTRGRVAKPFIETVIENPNGLQQLADICAEEMGAAVTNKLFIK